MNGLEATTVYECAGRYKAVPQPVSKVTFSSACNCKHLSLYKKKMLNFCVFGLYALGALVSKASAATYHHDQPQNPLVQSSSGLEVTATDGNGDPYWDYTGGTGPLLWTKLNRKEWPLCQSGDLQSPVNIDSKMKPSGFRYEWAAPLRACYNMTNNGRTIELRPTCPSIGERDVASIMIENDWFNLDNINFHTPSEHRFLDEYYPIEVHFVMKSPKTGKTRLKGRSPITGGVANSEDRALRYPRGFL